MRVLLYIFLSCISFNGYSQQTQNVDFLKGNVEVTVSASNKEVGGTVGYN